ncbi:MAG: FAD-dependent oxidoreductase, partial [Cyanobacteria bacterium]|nr:FAD-dependent oxidoreductase [Cyanobacteriota bacterium]
AGWYLQKSGFNDFLVLELEKEVGGNSSFGQNNISAYPWGAHYVPLANEESAYVREFFEELGIISGYQDGLANYNDLYLCHDPQERLYKDGVFQEGLVPKRGLQKNDEDEIARFFETIKQLRQSKGKDGKHAFAIPLDLSSEDAEFRDLDKISMSVWLEKNRFSSKPLLWYLNYCCRDDYGGTCDKVSAWAGLHYFAGRRGKAANAETNSVVTWPEGNGFLVQKLKEKLKDKIINGSMVSELKLEENQVTAKFIETTDRKPSSLSCDYAILCIPRFVALHVLQNYGAATKPSLPEYSPWLVANLSLSNIPSGKGEDVAWDNVSYYSQSLGYVVATHQSITTRQKNTVITYYLPLTREEPRAERARLMRTDKSEWVKLIVADLERMHPGISNEIISIDLWPWGHGMVRPSVGYIWGDDRKILKENQGRVHFAHSDMSGISNFEEAQYQGVEAAKRILAEMKIA